MALLDPPELSGHHDGVFGLDRSEGGLLLVHNARTVGGRSEDLWDLPGGKVRPGERLDQALRREWQEETGLEAEVGRLRLVTDGEKRRREAGPALYRWRAFVFDVHSTGTARPGDDIRAVRRVPVAEAVQHLSAPYHAALRRHLEGDDATYASVIWTDPLEAGAHADGASDGLRRLLALAGAAAAGRPDLLPSLASDALADGAEPFRIEETLLQIVPYAGFPRAIAAFGAVRPVLGPGPHGPDVETLSATGPETFERVYGETAARVRTGLLGLHPELERWTQGFAYGRVLARPRLTLLERELLAVAILTVLGRLEAPLLGHMRAAVRLGAEPADVAAAIRALPPVAAEADREAALRLLDRL